MTNLQQKETDHTRTADNSEPINYNVLQMFPELQAMAEALGGEMAPTDRTGIAKILTKRLKEIENQLLREKKAAELKKLETAKRLKKELDHAVENAKDFVDIDKVLERTGILYMANSYLQYDDDYEPYISLYGGTSEADIVDNVWEAISSIRSSQFEAFGIGQAMEFMGRELGLLSKANRNKGFISWFNDLLNVYGKEPKELYKMIKNSYDVREEKLAEERKQIGAEFIKKLEEIIKNLKRQLPGYITARNAADAVKDTFPNVKVSTIKKGLLDLFNTKGVKFHIKSGDKRKTQLFDRREAILIIFDYCNNCSKIIEGKLTKIEEQAIIDFLQDIVTQNKGK